MMRLELGAQVPGWGWTLAAPELRDWVQGVEAIGYDWVGLADPGLYAHGTVGRQGLARPVDGVDQHEVFTTLAFLAGCTSRVTLQSSVLILPQREPLLVAKQACELDVLSGGRFRLGVGASGQETNLEELKDPSTEQTAQLEEAVALLRICWSQEPVTFGGRFTTVQELSMLPKPITPGGPPILFGGSVETLPEQSARLGDGLVGSSLLSPRDAAVVIRRTMEYLELGGRDPASFQVQWTSALFDDPAETLRTLQGYRKAGATGLSLVVPEDSTQVRLTVDDHLRRLEMVFREFWPVVRNE